MKKCLSQLPYCAASGFKVVVASLLLLLGFATHNSAQTAFALSGNNLISFKVNAPGILLANVPVSGIAPGQLIEGLDFRPNTGQLYALGYTQSTGAARLYTIDLTSGAASAIGAAPTTLKANMGKISVDFNPTVDRIRVTGSDNSNYRLHPVTGALVATDGNLAFAATDVNASANPSIGAVAYTNSYIGATSTTLYNYDDSLNVFTTQNPPNNGTLNTLGASAITVNLADPSTDFDIYFDAGSSTNKAYFAANTATQTADHLFTVNLTTGVATMVGQIGNGIAIIDIAISLQPIETACDIKTVECVKYELLSISKNSSGDKVYRVRITNNCADKLAYAVFQLPNGITAVGASAGTYTSPGGHIYELRNPNFSPFYSIRFKDQSADGIANGQSDLFEYALPASANPNYIHVGTRTGTIFREVYLNVFSCVVSNTASKPGSEERDADNEWNTMGEFKVYPNPTDGLLFADLSAWEAQEVQLRAVNVQGQVLLFQSIQGGDSQQMIQIPDQTPEGLYFLELTAPDGQKQVRKFVVKRG